MTDADEIRRLDIKWWSNALKNMVHEVHEPENLEYLARKASIMAEKEHHDRGDTGYISIYTDPDLDEDVQDPGG